MRRLKKNLLIILILLKGNLNMEKVKIYNIQNGELILEFHASKFYILRAIKDNKIRIYKGIYSNDSAQTNDYTNLYHILDYTKAHDVELTHKFYVQKI